MNEDEVVSEGGGDSPLDSEPSIRDNRHVELEQLPRLHNDALVNHVCSWVHSRADATDIVQETYVRFFRLGDTTTVVSRPKAFLFRIAKNVATDFIRRRTVRDAFAEEETLRA